jgi:hypothetical protein
MSDLYKWKSISNEFKEACGALNVGEIFKDPK